MTVSLKTGQFRKQDADEQTTLSKLEIDNATVSLEAYAAVRSSLEKVLCLLDRAADQSEDAMIALGLSENCFTEPLNRHEVMVLASLLWVHKTQGRGGIYNDVLSLTRRINGKAMNLTMVYRTMERLLERNMLKEINALEEIHGRSRTYRVNLHGRQAFRMAILNAESLKQNPSSVAA